jgi:exodeoxyribonuclease VII large subunit
MRDDTTSPADRRVFTVAELNQTIQSALHDAFPGPVWVRGEVQRLPIDAARRQHVYFELHQAGASGAAAGFQIPAAILGWDRQRFGLGRYLDGSDPDLRLADRLEVCLECVVDFYPPYGKLSLKVIGVDREFTLGRLEARRREVLARLKTEGLLERNGALPLAELPLRVGLITAAGSAAERDFLSGLAASGRGFTVWRADCRMQGASVEPQVVAALRGLAALGLDVIVITRGGGSRADLSWFDQFGLAAAIALCPVPVVTAIGHEIDTAIADLVAHTRCKTPTAAAQLLVDRVAAAAARVANAIERLAAAAPARLTGARDRLQRGARGLERQVARRVRDARVGLADRQARLAAAARGRLARERARQEDRERRLGRGAPVAIAAARVRLDLAAHALRPARLLAGWPGRLRELSRAGGRLDRLAAAALAAAGRRLGAASDQARLLDPQRQFARGYTLTCDAAGRPLAAAAGLAPGDRLTTRFRDGTVGSIVEGIERTAAAARGEAEESDRKE